MQVKFAILAALGALAAGCSSPDYDDEYGVVRSGRFELPGWPETSRRAAEAMRQKYGEPAAVTREMLIWHRNGPWLRTIVHREEVQHEFPMPHADVLEQTVAYQFPVDKVDELAAFDGSLLVDRTKGTLTSRCDKESLNLLALNLADDIATGEKTVEQAREHLARAAHGLLHGEVDAYTQALRFTSPKKPGDPDRAVDDH